MLKNYLLTLGCFIDNEYLQEYLSLVTTSFYFSTTEYTEEHHIIPKSYYTHKYNRDCSLEDPNNFLVTLTYSDHFYAH